MAFLTLKQRCDVLYERLGVVISSHGLACLYKRHGIAYKFSRPQCRHILADTQLQTNERKEAAIQLLNLMASNQPLCYIDETSLNVSFDITEVEHTLILLFSRLDKASSRHGCEVFRRSTCLSSSAQSQWPSSSLSQMFWRVLSSKSAILLTQLTS